MGHGLSNFHRKQRFAEGSGDGAIFAKTGTPLLYSNRAIWALLLPLIAEQILAGLMGIADTIMVSNVNAEALSGVSLVDAINVLFILIFTALAAGGTIVCAQYIGSGRPDRSKAAGEQLMLASFVISLIPTVICLLGYKWILRIAYGAIDPGVMEAAEIYFVISAISYPFIALQASSAALFRAEGETKHPMYVSFIANGLNIVGNAWLIFGMGWGVFGAAVATLASRVVNAVVMLILQRNPKRILCFRNYFKLRPDFKLIKQVLRIAVPNAIENGLFQFGKLIVSSTVSTLGTAAISAQAMIMMTEGVHSYPSMAVGLGLTTVAGTCMGAGEVEQAKHFTKKLCIISEGAMMLMSVIFFFLLKPISFISNLTSEANTLFIRLMIILLIMKPILWILSFTLPNTMRAAGDVSFCAIVSAASMWIFRVGLTFVLCRIFNWGLYGVWFGWMFDWVIRIIFYMWRYLSGKWATKHVI